MMTPPLTMTPRYLAPIAWYARLLAAGTHPAGTHTIVPGAIYDLRRPVTKRDKPLRRTLIIDTRGPLNLTVPVEHAPAGTPLDRLIISGHGRWHEIHRLSLEAAYGRTPYFEHIYPALREIITPDTVAHPLVDLLIDLDIYLRHTLGITTPVSAQSTQDPTTADTAAQKTCAASAADNNAAGAADTTAPGTIHDPMDTALPTYDRARPYDAPLPPDLSILDLLFNLGPEESSRYLAHIAANR